MRNIKNLIYQISAVLIIISAVIYISLPQVASWIMVVSVVIFSVITLKTPYPGKSIRGRRLFGMQVISCFIMLAAAYLMFMRDNIWPLAMLLSTVLLLYTSIFIPKEIKREGLV